MARKNIFESVMREEPPAPAPSAAPAQAQPAPKFGAAKSLSSSIDALARQANMLIEGQTIVDLDPKLVDASFVADRMAADDQSYQELLGAIRERGQDSPVLVRPHPTSPGRYQVVFGHRRLRVAKELGRPLRAVVKSLADIEHVLAQGQENTARANLSFIEKVLFAQRLTEQNYAREVIQSALSVDYQTLSKMLTIPKVLTLPVIEAIGPARGIGRDRWLELRKLAEEPEGVARAAAFLRQPEAQEADSATRFDLLFSQLSEARPQARKPAKKRELQSGAGQAWKPQDGLVSGQIRKTQSAVTLVLKSKSSAFGDYLARNLDELYAAFKASQ